MSEQGRLDLYRDSPRGKDIFLCHTGADKPWVERLAGRIEAEQYDGRLLGVVFDKWDFAKASNFVLEIEKGIDACRFVGLVVSKAMLAADWPTMERTIAVCSDPSGSRGRVIPLLLENVTLPASLRIRNWIDFRDEGRFEESVCELIRCLRGESVPRGYGGLLPRVTETKTPYQSGPVVITSSVGADVVQERLVSNLFPVLQLPSLVHSGHTRLRDKEKIAAACGEQTLPPFISRGGKIFTFSDLGGPANSFKGALGKGRIGQEPFQTWFADIDKRRWAVELLNVSFKAHMRRRYLRFDNDGKRYFFAPYKGRPKRIWWCLGEKRARREITTPHMVSKRSGNGNVVKVQSGWRHQGVRASFLVIPSGLFFQIEPTWLLTNADGKTPRGGPRVGPILSHWLNQERNGQILRSVRFWSLVFAHGADQIEIPAGHAVIRIGLVPISGLLGFGIIGDQLDYDALMKSEMEDDLEVPQLSLFGEDADIDSKDDEIDEA